MTDQAAAADQARATADRATADQADATGDREPTFSEQLSQQMGGGRGLIESGIPVAVFVVVNVIWSLNPALIAAIAVVAAMVGYRLLRRQPIRHAINGAVGVGFGVLLAWRTGKAQDFYLPGIVMAYLYGVVLIGSVLVRHPVIGYMWAVISAGGKHWWRERPRLLRTFQWLTVVWAATFLAKAVVQHALWAANEANWLGVAKLAMGYPPYLLMLAVTVWAVRRVTHDPEYRQEMAPAAP
ncbi:MAG: DUF3159 domain-containing protein [Micromonosporaceae bacterium]